MNLTELSQKFKELQNRTVPTSFRKILKRLQNLLSEIDAKDISENEKLRIQHEIEAYLKTIETEQQAASGFRKVRRFLSRDFGFVPENYFVALGIAIGIAIGASLGLSFGIPFSMGIVYGPIIGSGIGLIAGIAIGTQLDKKKKDTDQVLKNL